MSTDEHTLGMFTIDGDLVVHAWDEWLERATGIAAADATGRPLNELVLDLEARGLHARLTRVLTDGVVEVLAPALHHYLIPCPPSAPSRRFDLMQQRVTIAPVSEGEHIVGAVITIEDVTARRERERDLAEMLDSPDEHARLHAAQVLAAEDEAAPTLAIALGDQSWRVRKTAAAGVAAHADTDLVTAVALALRTEHRDPGALNSTLQVLGLTHADATGVLVDLLRSEDADLRIYVALALGERGDRSATPALSALLDDPDVNVRYHAIEALGKLRAAAAALRLAQIAAAGDPFLAFAALDALARIGDEVPAAALLPLLRDPLLAEPAVDLLGSLDDLTVVAPLAKALDEEHIPPPAVARALASLFEREEQVYGDGTPVADEARRAVSAVGAGRLLAALEGGREEEAPALARVLSWLGDPQLTQALTRQIARPSVAGVVADALVRAGADGVERLLTLLDTDNDAVIATAVAALGRIGAPRAVPPLTRLLEQEGEVAIVAAGALAHIGDRRPFEELIGMLRRPDAAVRQAAVGALNAIGHPDMAARAAVLLDDPDPHVREAAVQIAGYFGYPACTPALLERCHDPDERVRRAAVAQLPFVEDARALPMLAAALGDATPAVRAAAARALAHAPLPDALPLLLSALADSDRWTRYYAAQALGRHQAGAAEQALARVIEEDQAVPVRLAAVEALGRIGERGAVATIARQAAADNTELAGAALHALGAIGGPEARRALHAALGARDTARRAAAAEALGHSGDPADIPLLRQVAEGDRASEVRAAAVAGLGATDAGAPALVTLAADPALRQAAVAALVAGGERWIETVAGGLRHPSAAVRRAMVEVLARIRRPTASAQVRAALADSDPAVRAAAEAALQRMAQQ
ncbi:MAG: hypothetical protein RLZZ387_4881 [Chloroflexota bacterium]